MINLKKDKIGFLKKFLDDFNVSDISNKAAECAFYLTLAIVPVLIFIISALAFIPHLENIGKQDMLVKVIPKQAYSVISVIINSAVTNRSVNFLVISLFFAMWTFSKAVQSIIKGINFEYNFEEKRSYIKLRGSCLFFALAFIIMVILSITLIVYGDRIGTAITKIIGTNRLVTMFYATVRYAISISAIIAIFWSFFTFGPSQSLKFKNTIFGAVITTFLWLILSMGYSLYANNFGTKKEIYGSLSTIVILMTWLYLCSAAIVIGYKTNAYLHKIKMRKIKAE